MNERRSVVMVAMAFVVAVAQAQAPEPAPADAAASWTRRTSDGQPDLLVSTYACDERMRPSRASRVSHTGYDTWLEVRDEWRRARTDQVAMCYR